MWCTVQNQLTMKQIPLAISGEVDLQKVTDILSRFSKEMTFQLVLKDMNHVKGDIESLAEHCSNVTILVTQTEQMHEFKNINGNIGIHFVISNWNDQESISQLHRVVSEHSVNSLVQVSFPQTDQPIMIDSIVKNQIREIVEQVNIGHQEKNKALMNGIYANQTGLYPTEEIGHHVKHLTVSSSITDGEFHEVLNVLGVNSAMVQKLNQLDGEYYLYNGSIILMNPEERDDRTIAALS